MRLGILVEGQTEEVFVNQLLSPHLASRGIGTTPVLISTSPRGRGGHGKRYSLIKKSARNLVRSFEVTTTLLDFYGLPADFPGVPDSARQGLARLEFLEAAFGADVEPNRSKFLPFLFRHEFESLLFADPPASARALALGENAGIRATLEAALTRIRDTCGGAEEIDDGRETCPSRRLLALRPMYQKTFHGPLAAAEIGLPTLRERCPHFDHWLTTLENLT